jgi:signal transduction histidine kinase/ActR/RegA family two-component response regulator
MIPAGLHPQEEARIDALHRLHILDTPPEERFDQLTRIAMTALQTPMASVSLIDTDRQWCKSSPGMAKPSVDRAISFCGHTVLQASPLIVPDATKDERFHDNPLVSQNPHLRAYIGVPLFSEEGLCVGSFCVLDSKPREFTPQQIEIMIHLATVAEREVRNIALNKSLEEARTARQEAEEAAKAKSGFLAMMSHEIRTPLNGVLGIADILAGTELTAAQQEYVSLIRSSGNTLLALINDILDFSKFESGCVELERLPIPVRAFLSETLALYVHAAQAKGVALESEVDPSVPEFVMGDPCRLRQILINLVGNALKFTKNGEVRVKVALGGPALATQLVFRVSDTGVGITPENLKRLFQPFTQAESSTTRNYGGTGLGLSICKLLVELMGGMIEAESRVGQGSTFTFSIPCLPCDAPPIVLTASESLPETGEKAKRENLKILVVEDNLINQRVVKLFLDKLGCPADCVSSGQGCLDKLDQQAYDIILMDVQMPGMDGHETTRRIRQRSTNESPWIIALTASAQDEDAAKCGEAGMDDFLTKPLRIEALNDALERFEKKYS